MIAYEKNGKLAVMLGTNLLDGENGYFRVPTPEGIAEANGMRVFNDAGTKKALIGAETDLMVAPQPDPPTPDPTQGGDSPEEPAQGGES